jgi:uncharacterized protein YozE (UPF0346 family)
MNCLERNGYGTQFNNLYLLSKDIIKKESKNEYGNRKMKKEIAFYRYIMTYRIPFPIPTIYEFGENYYIMQYFSNYVPLYQLFHSFSQNKKQDVYTNIQQSLGTLHLSGKKHTTKEHITNLLYNETKQKLQQRYEEIKPILDSYSFLKKVNNITLLTFDDLLERIEKKVHDYVESLHFFELCIIHGDCQFNNILYDSTTDNIVFIDPRGYFGEEDLYGIPEYDEAKLRFALSGYDSFDNSIIDKLTINDDNLSIPNMFLLDSVPFNDFIGTLAISIWLGNAHCFKDTPFKAIYSFYYARYLGTLYL